MTPAKLSKASPCFTTIQPSLRARWTKLPLRFGKLAIPKKQTASRVSYANVTRITSAGSRRGFSRSSLLGDDRDAPGAIADFDATQFFARFYIDNGDIV